MQDAFTERIVQVPILLPVLALTVFFRESMVETLLILVSQAYADDISKLGNNSHNDQLLKTQREDL